VKAPNQILKEIVHNLVSNSLKNTVAGEITLGYRCNDGCPQLFVADTGCGMDQEAIDCLFKPFFKQTSTNRASGFGLGLSICKTLADELEAELSVSSGVGAGTVVTLTLPRNSVCGSQSIDSLAISGSGAAVTRDSDSKVAYKERSIDLNNVDGLLIDDLRFVRDVLLRRLDAIGLSVFDCKSTSIPDLTRLAPKFVLTDLEMPVLSGFDIAHRIKESHPGIVVIAISERDDLLDRARECPDFDIVMTKVSLLTNDDEALRVFESFATRPHEPV
jgi:CheY-like chemotaxis protein/anti-sigma regulatory factor (Ser/Thr protein kinase)